MQFSLQVNPDDIGRQDVHRLAEHPGLGLDAADAPADNADAVDHRRMAVGADQRVRIAHAVVRLVHAGRQVLEVDLVHDADARRHHLEGVESLHAPFHELVALLVALEFELLVQVERVLRAVVIDLHRVVHHQVDRDERLDHLRVLAHLLRHAAHCGEVAEQRHAGEVLQHDAREHERDLVGALRVGLPAGELVHVRLRDLLAVAIPEHRLEHDADRYREPFDPQVQRFPEHRQRVELAVLEALQGAVKVMPHQSLRHWSR